VKQLLRFLLPFVVLPAVVGALALGHGLASVGGGAAVLFVGALVLYYVAPIPRWEAPTGLMAGVYPASYLVLVATHLADAALRHGQRAGSSGVRPCVG
jgi:hypothetical protein